MAREFSVVIERDLEGLLRRFRHRPSGLSHEARCLDEPIARVREAAELCLEVQAEEVEPLDFIRGAEHHRGMIRLLGIRVKRGWTERAVVDR